MDCLPTITAPTGSWARRSETSRADVRPTHRATVRSDERARPPRRAPGRSSTYPPQAPVPVQSTGIHACTKFPATPAKGTTCFRNFSIGNDLFTTSFTAKWVVVILPGDCVHNKHTIEAESVANHSWVGYARLGASRLESTGRRHAEDGKESKPRFGYMCNSARVRATTT